MKAGTPGDARPCRRRRTTRAGVTDSRSGSLACPSMGPDTRPLSRPRTRFITGTALPATSYPKNVQKQPPSAADTAQSVVTSALHCALGRRGDTWLSAPRPLPSPVQTPRDSCTQHSDLRLLRRPSSPAPFVGAGRQPTRETGGLCRQPSRAQAGPAAASKVLAGCRVVFQAAPRSEARVGVGQRGCSEAAEMGRAGRWPLSGARKGHCSGHPAGCGQAAAWVPPGTGRRAGQPRQKPRAPPCCRCEAFWWARGWLAG